MERDQTITDLELVAKVKTGDRTAFSELVKRHQRSLLRMSMRFIKDLHAAEDVVQEAFIKAFEKLHTFEGRSSFKSWLFQIAINTARNKIREYRFQLVDIDQIQIAVGSQAEETMIHNNVSELIQSEIEKLPFRQKTALLLRIYEDLSFQEIATIMECPYDTAKANYRHALIKLKEIFDGQKDLRSWTTEMGGFFMEVSHKLMEVEG